MAAVEPLTDSPLSPVICTTCGKAYEGETQSIPDTCVQCGSVIDLATQFAFSRGVDAFDYGQELLMRLSPRSRRKDPFSKSEMEAIRYYQQAYNSFQTAFSGVLAESQRRMAIEIIASIVFVQLQHQVISSIEAAYWQNLLKELTMQKELIEVEQKIATLPRSPIRWILKIRWRMRLNQLNAALIDIDHQIEKMEASILFAVPPNVRRKNLPPLEDEMGSNL